MSDNFATKTCVDDNTVSSNGNKMAGTLNMNGNGIMNLKTPKNNADDCCKLRVDIRGDTLSGNINVGQLCHQPSK